MTKPVLGDDAEITRFATFPWHYKHGKGPRYQILMPEPKHNETSVFETMGTTLQEKYVLGDAEITGRNPSIPVLGAICITLADIRAEKLRLDMDAPPSRHGAIRGWPPQDNKDQQKELAKALFERRRFWDERVT